MSPGAAAFYLVGGKHLLGHQTLERSRLLLACVSPSITDGVSPGYFGYIVSHKGATGTPIAN